MAQRKHQATGMGTPEEIARRWEAPSCPTSRIWQLGAAPTQPGEREGRSPKGVHPRAPRALVASAEGTLVPTLTTGRMWTSRTAAVAADALTVMTVSLVLNSAAAAKGRQGSMGWRRRWTYYFLEVTYVAKAEGVIGLRRLRNDEGVTGTFLHDAEGLLTVWPHSVFLFPSLAADGNGLGAGQLARATLATD